MTSTGLAPARPPGGEEAPSAARASRAGRAAVVVVPALVLVIAGWLRRWTTDDAFINYRIVRMLVEGHGPVFNIGQRIEAYTSPLWIGVLTVGDVVLPIRLEYVSVICSLALSAIGMLALGSGAMRLLGGSSKEPTERKEPTESTQPPQSTAPPIRVWVPLGSLVLLALPPMWDFSTAGLEFGLTIFWIGGLIWCLSRWATAERPLTAGEALFVGLGPLVRPDMTLYSVAILVFVVACRWRSESHRQRLRVLAAAAGLPVLYQLFRMAYFASLVPNTALAKAADRPHWREGLAYLVNLFAPYWLLLPVVVVVAVAVLVGRPLDRKCRLTMAILPAAGCLHALYIVRAGGDYMHARLLLPSLVAVLAPVAVVPLRRPLAPLVGVVAVWAVIAAVGLRMTDAVHVERSLIADGRQAAIGPLHRGNPVTLEDQGWGTNLPSIRAVGPDGLYAGLIRLPFRVRPGVAQPLVMMFGIGAVGYSLSSRVNVLDRLGLADALTARFRVAHDGFIGHEKPIPFPWLAARVTDDRTTAVVFGNDGFARPLYQSPAGRFDQDVAAARRALQCPPLRRLQDATEGSLTVGRALSNLWHAPELTLLRVAPEPNKAVGDLC